MTNTRECTIEIIDMMAKKTSAKTPCHLLYARVNDTSVAKVEQDRTTKECLKDVVPRGLHLQVVVKAMCMNPIGKDGLQLRFLSSHGV